MSNLAKVLIVIGFVMLIFEVGTSTYLYQSFGVTLTEKLVYGGVGAILAILCAISFTVSHFLWTASKPIIAVFMFMIGVLCMLPLVWVGHVGFMSVALTDLAKNGYAFQAAKSQLDNATTSLKYLNKYSNLDIAKLQNEKEQLERKYQNKNYSLMQEASSFMHEDCTPKQDGRGHFYRAKAQQFCARKSSLMSESDKTKIADLDRAINGYNELKNLNKVKENALLNLAQSEVGTTSSENDIGVHPLFVTLANLTDKPARDVQSMFVAISAFIFSFMTAIILYLGYSLPHQPYQNVHHFPNNFSTSKR